MTKFNESKITHSEVWGILFAGLSGLVSPVVRPQLVTTKDQYTRRAEKTE
jgi:hypothetical protein